MSVRSNRLLVSALAVIAGAGVACSSSTGSSSSSTAAASSSGSSASSTNGSVSSSAATGSNGASGGSKGSVTGSTAAGSNGSSGSAGPSTGSAGSTASGSTTGTTGSTTYCDGFQATDSASDQILVQYYQFNRALERGGCDTELVSPDGGSVTLPSLGGVWDVDSSDNGAGSPAHVLFAVDCADFGFTDNPARPVPDGGLGAGFVSDGGDDYTAPAADAGFLSVAAAITGQGSSTSLWGVVTAVYPWSVSEMKSGTFYIQDIVTGTPAAGTGVSIYFDDPDLMGVGGNYPYVGQVVSLTNLKWSPYKGQNQFAGTNASMITFLGTAPLPAAVQLSASDLSAAGDSTSNPYLGMRVTTGAGSFVDSSAMCPTALEYTSSGG